MRKLSSWKIPSILFCLFAILLSGCKPDQKAESVVPASPTGYKAGPDSSGVNWKTIPALAPKKNADLTLWLRADKGVSVAPVGTEKSSVSKWKDESDNGVVFAPANPKSAPLLAKSKGPRTFPVVRFVGKEQGLFSPEILGSKLIKPDSVSLVLVMLQDKNHPLDDTFGWGTCGTVRFNTHFSLNGSLYFQMGKLESNSFIASGPKDWFDQMHIVSVVRDGLSARISVDGAERASITGGFPITLDTNVSGPIVIGDLCGNGFKGDMAEILLFKRGLAQTEERSLLKHLSQKYGIPLK